MPGRLAAVRLALCRGSNDLGGAFRSVLKRKDYQVSSALAKNVGLRRRMRSDGDLAAESMAVQRRDQRQPVIIVSHTTGMARYRRDRPSRTFQRQGGDEFGICRITVDRGVAAAAPDAHRLSQQRKTTADSIIEVEDHALVEMMTRAASWERLDGRSDEWVTTDAPMKVASTYLQRVGQWRLPVLTGLINAPTLRADGSLLVASGYDRATGLLLNAGGVQFPLVPDQPTRTEAVAALKVLEDLVGTFPFVDQPGRSVMLSAILTACIRRSLPTAPMHAFTAPTAGSGKSMLVDLISLIASGREAGVISPGKTEAELEKRLGACHVAQDLQPGDRHGRKPPGRHLRPGHRRDVHHRPDARQNELAADRGGVDLRQYREGLARLGLGSAHDALHGAVRRTGQH